MSMNDLLQNINKHKEKIDISVATISIIIFSLAI